MRHVLWAAFFAGSLLAQAPPPSSDPDDPGAPVLKRKGAPERKAPTTELPPLARIPEPLPDSDAPRPVAEGPEEGEAEAEAIRKLDLIQRAQIAAFQFNDSLPNFICDQTTSRYESKTIKPDWKLKDRVELELMYLNGREDYRNIRINGKLLKKGSPEESGSWSLGDFGTTLVDVLSTSTDAKFTKRSTSDRIAGIETAIYDFTVEKANSHWEIRFDGSLKPAYKGTLYIDPQTARVLRIEKQSRRMPTTYAIDTVEMTVEYGWVEIAGQKHLLPVDSVNLACHRDTFNCSKNEIQFKNYRKFGAESSISTTDSSVSFDGAEEVPPPPKKKKP
jgi:hypothetical protein